MMTIDFDQDFTKMFNDELRELEVLKASLKLVEQKKLNKMGEAEKSLEDNLKKLKVKGEVYFGVDNFVGNSMHKIYKNFYNQESILIDNFKEENQELFSKLLHLWTLLSNLHFFFAKPVTTSEEKETATKEAKEFTKLFPIYFPEQSITRKIHILGFVIPKFIREDTSDNICHKFLKIEQAGERVHNVWNTLTRRRFFAIKDKKMKLKSIFMEYENSLYRNIK